MVKLALAFAYDRAGPLERAVALADEARRAFDELGDTWGAASSAVAGAVGALRRGDLATTSALVAEAVRLHADYEVGAVPVALLEALLAERRGDVEAAAAAYRRALELSERAGFADHASFALGPRFGRLRERELRRGRSAVSPRVGGRRRASGVMAGRTREGEARAGRRGSRRRRVRRDPTQCGCSSREPRDTTRAKRSSSRWSAARPRPHSSASPSLRIGARRRCGRRRAARRGRARPPLSSASQRRVTASVWIRSSPRAWRGSRPTAPSVVYASTVVHQGSSTAAMPASPARARATYGSGLAVTPGQTSGCVDDDRERGSHGRRRRDNDGHLGESLSQGARGRRWEGAAATEG